MLRNKSQNNQLYLLLTKLGIDAELKEEMVYRFTNGRTNRSSKMTVNECQAMINELSSSPTIGKEDKMRKKIISLFRKMGYIKEDNKVDMTAVEDWVLKYGYLKKSLNKYRYNELPKLVSQAEAVYQSFIISL